MALLEIKGFKKKFENLEVLKGIDFELEKGETLAIIGSSGSIAGLAIALPQALTSIFPMTELQCKLFAGIVCKNGNRHSTLSFAVSIVLYTANNS